jgi:phosphoglycolate phosphatase
MDVSLTSNGKRDVIRIVLDTLDPERKSVAVMIGDRKFDITGANDNQIDSIGVLWGYGSLDEISEGKPLWIANAPEELFDIICKN